jgi:hypothetical protein
MQVVALEMLRAAGVQHSRDIRRHFVLAQAEPVFVNLLRSPGIDSQPGYIGLRRGPGIESARLGIDSFSNTGSDVQQTGLEEAQAAAEQTCTGAAHAAAEEARPEAAELTLPVASHAG